MGWIFWSLQFHVRCVALLISASSLSETPGSTKGKTQGTSFGVAQQQTYCLVMLTIECRIEVRSQHIPISKSQLSCLSLGGTSTNLPEPLIQALSSPLGLPWLGCSHLPSLAISHSWARVTRFCGTQTPVHLHYWLPVYTLSVPYRQLGPSRVCCRTLERVCCLLCYTDDLSATAHLPRLTSSSPLLRATSTTSTLRTNF